jgi:hypothetical protein
MKNMVISPPSWKNKVISQYLSIHPFKNQIGWMVNTAISQEFITMYLPEALVMKYISSASSLVSVIFTNGTVCLGGRNI